MNLVAKQEFNSTHQVTADKSIGKIQPVMIIRYE